MPNAMPAQCAWDYGREAWLIRHVRRHWFRPTAADAVRRPIAGLIRAPNHPGRPYSDIPVMMMRCQSLTIPRSLAVAPIQKE